MNSILRLTILFCALIFVGAYARNTNNYNNNNNDNQAEAAARLERQAGGGHHHDVVDFGAHTGHKGSFGWYADFPVHSHH